MLFRSLEAGVETLRGINDRRGRGWRQQIKQWFREFAYAARCAEEEGVEWALARWRAGKPGSQGADTGKGAGDDKPEPDELQDSDEETTVDQKD